VAFLFSEFAIGSKMAAEFFLALIFY